MSFGGDKTKIYSCPYDPTHKVRGDRFLNHTTRCARKRNVPNDVPVAAGKSLPAPFDTQKICFLTKGEKEQERRLALEKFKLDNPQVVANSKRIFLESKADDQKQGLEPKHNTKHSDDAPSSSSTPTHNLIDFDSPSTTQNVPKVSRWGPGFGRREPQNLMD